MSKAEAILKTLKCSEYGLGESYRTTDDFNVHGTDKEGRIKYFPEPGVNQFVTAFMRMLKTGKPLTVGNPAPGSSMIDPTSDKDQAVTFRVKKKDIRVEYKMTDYGVRVTITRV